jgi:hypothetical protein
MGLIAVAVGETPEVDECVWAIYDQLANELAENVTLRE